MSMGLVVVLVATAAACSSDDSKSAATDASATTDLVAPDVDTTVAPETSDATTTVADTTAETTPESTAPATDNPRITGLRSVVETLASDDLAGRDNGTPGSTAAQDFLIAQLAEFAQPAVAGATGPDAYRQSFDVGTNVIGIIPGTDLADEYVVVGAHYDHLGSDCTISRPGDTICNGATDNATGVATALAIGRAIAAGTPPRRTVVIALWDAEEDGLLGSAAYVANPIVPLAQTIAYINFDMQGTNISPSLRNVTVLVGTESGGPNLVSSAKAATAASSLDTVMLSLLFGQGRSDYANFVNVSVPSAFFTDATPPCYHTNADDISIVDFPKLEQQVATAEALLRDLVDTDSVPEFAPGTPPASFDDAVSIHDLLLKAQPDFPRFSNRDEAAANQFVTDLGAIVDAGPEAFDAAAVNTLLGGTVAIVELWSTGECDGFLEPTT